MLWNVQMCVPVHGDQRKLQLSSLVAFYFIFFFRKGCSLELESLCLDQASCGQGPQESSLFLTPQAWTENTKQHTWMLTRALEILVQILTFFTVST